MFVRRSKRQSHESWLTSYADLITNLLIFFMVIIAASTLQSGKLEKIKKALKDENIISQDSMSLSDAKNQIEQQLKISKIDENVKSELTDAGLEITFQAGIIFDTASAAIRKEMEEPLSKIIEVLRPYADKYRMALEGHADERPIRNGPFASNWELAASRAIALRNRFEDEGFDKFRMHIESYGETKPLQANQKTLGEEESLARQRRVVIRLF